MTADRAGAARGAVPDELEEYRIVRLLGQGGMGRVYLAEDRLLARLVAVKIIAASAPSPAARARFFVEARAVARLSHPNVVVVHRVGEVRRQPFLVSEYVRGQTLAELAKPVPWRRALDVAVGLARGLAAAHRRGVLHRDIKPGNAILSEDGTVKLLDFGLAELSPEGALSAVTEPPASHLDAPSTADGGGHADDDRLPESTASQSRAPSPKAAPIEASSDARDPATPPPFASLKRVAGTPLYMAPEIWRGEPATARADVYALGVVLYELCTGEPPYGRLGVAALLLALRGSDPPPLQQVAAGVDARLAEIVDRCVRRDPDLRYRDGDALREALEQIAAPVGPREAVPAGNPYRGLSAFEAEHRSLFFGRSAEILGIVDRLRADPRVVVAGDSGTGKSSLCRAGVLPAVSAGALGASAVTVRVTLGRHPLAALAAALAPLSGDDEAALGARLRAEPTEVGRALRERGTVVLFVDQLEELCTLAAPDEAAIFAEALHALADRGSGVRLLATARSDFLTRLSALPGLGDDLPEALYLLRPLRAERLREAVIGPAAAKGVSFESEAVIEALVREAEDEGGGLPLLQFALAELWEKRDEARGVIPASALETIGGVSGSLARHADEVLALMPAPHRAAARAILLALVTAEGTRSRRPEAELLAVAGSAAGASAALSALLRGRLLVAHEAEGGEGSAYTIAHEALLQGWDTLRGWLGHDEEGRALRQRLERAAAEWERLGRRADTLWGDRLLRETAGIAAPRIGTREAAFLGASRRAARAKLWIGLGSLVSVAAMLTLLGLYGWRQKHHADEQAQKVGAAKSTAQQRARKARDMARVAVASRPQGGTTLATQALREVEEDPEQVPGWLAAAPFAAPAYLTRKVLEDHHGELHEAAWGPQGVRVATASSDGAARLWNADNGGNLVKLVGHQGEVLHVAYSPDVTRVVTTSTDGTARLWNLDGTLAAALEGHAGAVRFAAFSGDGGRVVTVGDDPVVRVWKVASGALLGELRGHTASVRSAAWSADGTRLCTAGDDGSARVWDVERRASIAVLQGHRGAVTRAEPSPDGTHVVTASADGTARIWKVEGGPSVATLPHAAAVTWAAWSPDGARLVTAGDDHTARIWSAGGQLLHALSGHTQAIVQAAWSPDGARIVTASSDGTARVWSARDGTLVATLAGHHNRVTSAAWSPDGARVVTASADGSARVWEVAVSLVSVPAPDEPEVPPAEPRVEGAQVFLGGAGAPVVALAGLDGEVRHAALSADRQWLATVSSDRGVPGAPDDLRVWSMVTGEPGPLSRRAEGIVSVAWSPDGGSLVTASTDGTARIWGAGGKHLTVLRGHTSPVTSATFSARGDHVVTASLDHTVRVWKTDGTLVAVLTGHESPVLRAWFTADGTSVAARYDDGRALAWVVDPRLVQRALWLSTPYCLDADDRRRLLGASKPAAEAAAKACEHMSRCLHETHRRPIESKYDACLATFHEEQTQAER